MLCADLRRQSKHSLRVPPCRGCRLLLKRIIELANHLMSHETNAELHHSPDRNVFIMVWNGDITMDCYQANLRRTAQHANFAEYMAILHDIRNANLGFGFAQLIFMHKSFDSCRMPILLPARAAFLVRTPLQFGQARQQSIILNTESRTCVTYSEAAAKAYVGLPEDYPLPMFGRAR